MKDYIESPKFTKLMNIYENVTNKNTKASWTIEPFVSKRNFELKKKLIKGPEKRLLKEIQTQTETGRNDKLRRK